MNNQTPIEVSTLESFQSVSDSTKVMGYDQSANKVGFISVGQLKSTTYCGCRWRRSEATPVGEPIGSLPKIERLIDLFGLGGYIVHDDHSRQKLSPTNHNVYLTGGTALLDGQHGHYNWGSGVGIFYAQWYDGEYDCEAVDTVPIPGRLNYYIPVFSRSCAGYAAIDRTNLKLVNYINRDVQYRGGNNNANYDGTWCSLLGKPVSNIPIATAATYARKNGSLWFANSRVVFFITAALMRIYFHNRNIQAGFNASLTADNLHQGGLGSGIDLPFSWGNNGYNPYLDLGAGVDRGDFTGIFSTTITGPDGNTLTVGNIPSFAGLKNFYKYLWAMTEDELLQCNVDGSQTLFVDDVIDGHLFDFSTVTGKTVAGTTPTCSSANWYFIKRMNLENLTMVPVEVGGTESTYYGDGHYNPASTSGLRGALRLGYAGNGGPAGSCMLYGSLAPSRAAANWGFALCEFQKAFSTKPTFFS